MTTPRAPGRRALAARTLQSIASVAVALGLVLALAVDTSAAAPGSFLGRFAKVTRVASTMPGNGDVNPYGVAVVGTTMGRLVSGDVLVSNFNAKSNLQGTGTTIVEVAPTSGKTSVFAQVSPRSLSGACRTGVGLTTALAVLPGGWVVVGNWWSANGLATRANAGCLVMINDEGRTVSTISGQLINGPWDMAWGAIPGGVALFVANTFNGTLQGGGQEVNEGTVVRIDLGLRASATPHVESMTVVANGLAEETNAAAFVLGPTGLALGRDGTLYVADTLANRIAAVPAALSRSAAVQGGADVSVGGGLSAPLGLVVAPNGDLLAANGGNGDLVEITPGGRQVAMKDVEPAGAGSLFGLAIAPSGKGVYFGDDSDNTLKLLHP
jgi:sugar lactone lactonase YvrE